MQMIRRTLLSTCVAAMAAASAGAVLAQTKEVKVGYALAVNSHYGAAAQAWADAVERARTAPTSSSSSPPPPWAASAS